MVLQLFTLLGALGMFLYGMNLMSSGLQKAAGDRLRNLLSAITANPFRGVLTGIGITSIIQSSSATTVMVVSFVNAGLLTLVQGISVIMGANIGTTVTAWLVSWLGFKADISILAIPLMALGFILSISKKDSRRNISELIVGFSLLFLGLSLMKNSVPDLQQTPEVLSFIQEWQGYGFGSTLIFLVLGVILTLVLQSSSATMALTLIMLNMGWIHFGMACAMVLGENIGTTITANIAAAVGNTSAKRAALAHTVFNVFGVVWALITFPWFLKLVGWITASIFGLPNPADEAFTIEVTHDAQGNAIQSDSQTAALYGLSMLHTCFNTVNTALLIGFVPAIEKLVCAIIKGSKKATDNLYRLKYIEAGNMSTPELATEQAFNEIIHFARISHNGLGYIRSAIEASKKEDFEFYREKLVKYEEISDRIEYEIATFLNSVSTADISETTSMQIKSMYKIIGELESLGDSGEAISRMLSRRNSHNKSFTPETIAHIEQMIDAIHHAYEVMINNLSQAHAGTLLDISNALQAEEQINQLRNQLRESEIEDIEQNKTNYQTSVYYLDIVSELEKMGDFMINISQALERAFIK